MADLLEQYFKEDLNEEELNQIQARIDESSADAGKFLGLAMEECRTMGLKDPGSIQLNIPVRAMLAIAAILILCTTVLFAVLGESPKGNPESEADAYVEDSLDAVGSYKVKKVKKKKVWQGTRASRLKKALKRKQMAEDEPQITELRNVARGPVALSQRAVSVTSIRVDQLSLGPVIVWVEDSRGIKIQELYKGNLRSGSWSFEWDGRDARGLPAESGTYKIAMKKNGDTAYKDITLKTIRK